jgi:catechol 2,3-dioxygenase-like lactoylglutathione lyase family enzyme
LGQLESTGRCTKPSYACFAARWGPRPQHIELENSGSTPKDLLSEIGFYTKSAVEAKRFLAARHIATGKILKDSYGRRRFEVYDPEGHCVVFMDQSGPIPIDDPPPNVGQVGRRIIHAGFVVRDRAAMDKFYKDILGFHVYWHGGMKDDQTNWVDMQVPDGTDWIEYMLDVPANADQRTLGVMNHIALGVPDIHAAYKQLLTNGMKLTEEPQIGRDGKWQLNLYDPDDTRVELMEFTPVEKPCCSGYTGPHPKP